MAKKILQLSILIVITSYCVYSSFDHLISTFEIQSHDEGNRRFEERLKNLRDLIPLEHGVIGYISDEDIASVESDPSNASGEYVLSQYALSPLILDAGNYHEWNILNLTSDTYEIWNRELGNEYKLVGSGGGFYLVQRLPK